MAFAQPSFIKNIKGKTVKSFVEVDPGEDFDEKWPGILFTDGSILVIQQDAEGNGPGFMALESKDGKDLGCAG